MYENNQILETLRQGQIEGLAVGATLTLGILLVSKTARQGINRLGLTLRKDKDE